MPVVVVESPAKAKTINKYLGDNYTVLASYGHVRDLPPKDGSVDTDHDFEMKWEVAADSRKHVKAIVDALKDDNALILATDPDREGEAISWHLEETLRGRKAIKKDTPVSRVVFNAITKSAVTEAMKNPRQVDAPLVEAYLARRALDYLVGFNLSPVLWRKLPGAKSAGRVQSVCLRLIVEREMEIEAFRAREYWSVKAVLATPRGQEYEARLTMLAGEKLDKFSLTDATAAEMAVQAVESRDLAVASVEAKPASRNPSAPFMTSTLQQEASRKFGMGARATMSTAQRLYEAGHITYMRTDGIDMAPEAVHAARDAIKDRYGDKYVPSSPRMYKNKAKNAQEAHECIRPTDMAQDAASLKISDADQRKLYDLIWKRTLASQMEAARMERTTVTLASADRQVELRASGQVVLFDGFLKVYEEGRDEPAAEDDDRRLPQISEGEPAEKRGVTPEQHFTQPPPRYTEATLVKRMEELGIGRPSTYASIVTTIQDREYVRKDKGRLIPEDKGRLVTAFLSNYFRRYVEYDFTADLENQLDHVSAGETDWKELLARFWRDFSAAIAETSELRITEVLEKINEVLEPHLFPPKEDGTDPRLCPNCEAGRLSMRTARSGGAFIGCSNYPECRFTRPFGPPLEGDAAPAIPPEGKMLGEDQGDPIWLHDGRFGPYVQRGVVTEEVKKPPRQSVPRDWPLETVDLEKALMLLNLPREVGTHPEDGVKVWATIGRYGPYLKHNDEPAARGGSTAPLPELDDVFTIGMNRAVELLAQKASSRGGRGQAAKPLRELGEHPAEGGAINVMEGRYGPYVKWEKVNATLPKGTEPEAVTMEMAVELIAEKAAKKGTRKKAAPKKAAAKKPAAKKPAAKKAAPKKAAATKSSAKKAAGGAETSEPAEGKTAQKKTAARKAPAKKTAAKKADGASGDPQD
ncbi:type I DNA topoisomerase [Profundibacterium mesophilum]|uniref:DNA topoisomerase 1 n=1 Tax=Profundibacterium mesophilum KAUST100406-0324 TaxID=1037889 RepID=A0A921NUM0_9RHOB|nr:type I DNA topoisomerase [Profundibacterium mesophilum]KAF0675805.1 DNA topoisomerase [Profundibacterium mesophilum KAUST100406-0324]